MDKENIITISEVVITNPDYTVYQVGNGKWNKVTSSPQIVWSVVLTKDIGINNEVNPESIHTVTTGSRLMDKEVQRCIEEALNK